MHQCTVEINFCFTFYCLIVVYKRTSAMYDAHTIDSDKLLLLVINSISWVSVVSAGFALAIKCWANSEMWLNFGKAVIVAILFYIICQVEIDLHIQVHLH